MKKKLDPPVLLYDGYCFLCTRSANILIKIDKKIKIKLAPLQSIEAKRILKKNHFGKPKLDTLLLLHQNQLFQKSEAVFQILRIIGGGWKIFLIFKIIPLFIRDFFYDFISKNRYAWFGKKEQCDFISIEKERMLKG